MKAKNRLKTTECSVVTEHVTTYPQEIALVLIDVVESVPSLRENAPTDRSGQPQTAAFARKTPYGAYWCEVTFGASIKLYLNSVHPGPFR